MHPSESLPSSYFYPFPYSTHVVIFLRCFFPHDIVLNVHLHSTGTDSRAGTIVNVETRFKEIGGTDDYATGQSAAQSLASSNPALAILNADSYEYFAENNPPLE